MNIKTGLFTADEQRKATKSIQNRKSVELDEIPAEIRRISRIITIILQ